MPVYNEEKTIEKIVEKVQNVNLGKIKKELIVINDGSKDKTREIIQNLMKKYKNIRLLNQNTNQGKGAAIRAGLKNFDGDILVIQDGDLEYNPEDFKRLIKPILDDKAKVVYGSRVLGKIKGFQIFHHYIGNLGLSLITSLLYLRRISDMETGYKMMTKDVIKNIGLKAKRFDFEPEITAKIIKKGYKIIEVPIIYNSRSFQEGKKITVKDGIIALYYLLKYRFFN